MFIHQHDDYIMLKSRSEVKLFVWHISCDFLCTIYSVKSHQSKIHTIYKVVIKCSVLNTRGWQSYFSPSASLDWNGNPLTFTWYFGSGFPVFNFSHQHLTWILTCSVCLKLWCIVWPICFTDLPLSPLTFGPKTKTVFIGTSIWNCVSVVAAAV